MNSRAVAPLGHAREPHAGTERHDGAVPGSCTSAAPPASKPPNRVHDYRGHRRENDNPVALLLRREGNKDLEADQVHVPMLSSVFLLSASERRPRKKKWCSSRETNGASTITAPTAQAMPNKDPTNRSVTSRTYNSVTPLAVVETRAQAHAFLFEFIAILQPPTSRSRPWAPHTSRVRWPLAPSPTGMNLTKPRVQVPGQHQPPTSVRRVEP